MLYIKEERGERIDDRGERGKDGSKGGGYQRGRNETEVRRSNYVAGFMDFKFYRPAGPRLALVRIVSHGPH